MYIKNNKCLIIIALAAFLGFWKNEASAQTINYARPYIVVDVNTGDVLAQNNSFEPWFPASLTKMMTAYLAFKAMTDGSLNKNSQIILSKYDVSQAPSKSGYRAGTILSLDTALKIMLVKSTNGIATAIGKTIAKNNAVFVAMMNDQAKKLEMSYSHFTSANGLPNINNYSTARDLALLAIALRRDFPQYAYYFNIKALDLSQKGQIVLNSNNLLGRVEGINGMKTGYICASGYNLVASAKRGNREIIAVVLGAPRLDIREEVTANLLELGFNSSDLKIKNNIFNMRPRHKYAKHPPNLRSEMCNIKAAKMRLHYLDKNFRPILNSPYITAQAKDLNILRVKPIYEPVIHSVRLKNNHNKKAA